MNEKIMVVDDESGILTLMEIALRRKGFSVMTANDAEKALALLTKEKPDLIILDVMMPGISGLELCEQLRSLPETARIPVIMLSARYDAEAIQRGLAAGADDYVQKTSSPSALIGKIQTLLTRNGQCANSAS